MNIQPAGKTVPLSTQPAESSTEGLADNIQYLCAANETLLSQQSLVVQSQEKTPSALHLSTEKIRDKMSQREEKIISLANKWGTQDIETVTRIALCLDCYSLEGLQKLFDTPSENIYLHRSAHPDSLNLDKKIMTNRMRGNELYPNGGTFFLVSLKKKVTNPYSEIGNISLVSKLSDVLQRGGTVTCDIAGLDCRSAVVVLPKDETIPFESDSFAINPKDTHSRPHKNPEIIRLAQKWRTNDIETVENIVKSLLFYDTNILSKLSDMSPKNIYLHCSVPPGVVDLEGHTLSNCRKPSQYYPNGSIEFMISLAKDDSIKKSESNNINLICNISSILKCGGKITFNVFGLDRRSVVVELPLDESIPFELSSVPK